MIEAPEALAGFDLLFFYDVPGQDYRIPILHCCSSRPKPTRPAWKHCSLAACRCCSCTTPLSDGRIGSAMPKSSAVSSWRNRENFWGGRRWTAAIGLV